MTAPRAKLGLLALAMINVAAFLAAGNPSRIPGGLPGVWLVGGVGLAGCLFSFVLGFIPPSQLKTGDTVVSVLLLALAVLVLSAPPFVLALLRGRPRAPEPAVAASASAAGG